MRWIIWGAAAAIVLGVSGPASAQMGGMMFDPPPSAKAAKPATPAPRAKQYYRSAKPGPRYYYRSGVTPTCGEFHYWSGQRCVDARTTPPDLKPSRR
ncbi:MAG TPA: hypothetical protein VG758_26520 [Hyphomicrobiaceae bacterium]|jgi:hypothetical protein|nr:hypothetical protein [Hyphomicrobiaceae bacterium]